MIVPDKIETKFEEDEALIKSLCPNEHGEFAKWFSELNAENIKRNESFYSGTKLEESTGVKCWFDFFVEGYTPAEALDEDAAAA